VKTLQGYRTPIAIVLVASSLGVLVSFIAQPGGIGQLNAFLAPILGPWSKCLKPNAARVASPEVLKLALFTLLFLGVSVFTAIGGNHLKKRYLRIITRCVGYAAIVLWCLCGLHKVVVELT